LLLAKAEVASFAEASEFPVVGPNALEMRKWTDKTGKYSIMAAFIKFYKGKAHLERGSDGEVIQVSMTKLSDGDQQYIRDKLRARRGRK
jgi:hypothetical protein